MYSFNKLYVLLPVFWLRVIFEQSPVEGSHPGVSHDLQIYNCRHTTHKLATHYTQMCRLFTQCVVYLPNVSLSWFGECVAVGISCHHNTAEYDDISVSWTIYLFCCGEHYMIYSSQFASQALATMRPMWYYLSKQPAWAISHWCPNVFRFSLPWDDWCVCVWSARSRKHQTASPGMLEGLLLWPKVVPLVSEIHQSSYFWNHHRTHALYSRCRTV